MPAVQSKDKSAARKLRALLLVLAIALGLFFLLRAILTFIEPTRAYKLVETVPAKASAATTRTQATFDPEFDGFHRESQNGAVEITAPVIGEDAPETDLNVTLTGLTVLGDGNGSAILRLPDGTESAFSRDDVILRNVKLEAVYPMHIIISRNGAHERVTFERASGTLFGKEREEVETPQPRISQAQVETVSQNLNARAQQALEGFTPETFFKSIRPTPVRENGQIIGYRLASRNRALDLGELGYESGDVVTHIGGNDLRQGTPNFTDIQQQITRNPQAASLTLNRKGQVLTIRLN